MRAVSRWITRAAAAAAALGMGYATPAIPQGYPSTDIHLICAFPAGSGSEVIVRYYAEKLRPVVGRTVVVENKPGAAGNIATEYIARAKPDGHTIYLHTGSSVAANMHLFKQPPVDAAKALTVAATINQQAFMLVVDAKSPFRTVADLTAYLKQKGDKASYATAATSGKVMGELYKSVAGLSAVEVSYKSAPDSLNDMLSGAVDYGVHDPVFALAQMREGRLRVLAVGSARRLQSQPDIPTMTESGVPGIDLTGWFAAMIPAATPRPIVAQINEWFNKVTSSEETRAFLNNFAGIRGSGPPRRDSSDCLPISRRGVVTSSSL